MEDDGTFLDKGMMSTKADMVFIKRYIYLRDGLREIIQKV
jgi:hypothetical protein